MRSNRNLTSQAAAAIGLLLVAWGAWQFLRWGVLDATWTAATARECAEAGACWAVIPARLHVILFGTYPIEENWRPLAACTLVLAWVAGLAARCMWAPRVLMASGGATLAAFLLLMYGGVPGLPFVSTEKWGGLPLTFFLYVVGIGLGFPLSVLIALARRSQRAWLADTVGLAVDFLRTIPMVMVLFSAVVLLPLLLPGTEGQDKLWRVALAFALVYACFQSEVVRAGFQAIPRAQDEAARALALTPVQRVRLVLLPQALLHGLPATVNLLVATLKETSIVAIIGFFDFTASAQLSFGNGEWASAYVEVYLFTGLVYFLLVSGVALLGRRVEHELSAWRG